MILNETEFRVLFPEYDIPSVQVEQVLRQSEAIAIGPEGSNRSLDLQKHVETQRLNGSGIAKIKHWPVYVAEGKAPSLEIRTYTRANRSSASKWTLVNPDSWTLDDNEVSLLSDIDFGYDDFGRGTRIGRGMQKRVIIEARITYYAGWNFSEEMPMDWQTSERSLYWSQLLQIKSALAGIAKARINAQVVVDSIANGKAVNAQGTITPTEGVVKKVTRGKTSIEYESGRESSSRVENLLKTATSNLSDGSSVEGYLTVFRQYRSHRMPI